MASEEIYERFQDYLDNLLNTEENSAFENQLKTDALFAKKFNLFKENQAFLNLEFSGEKEKFVTNLKVISNQNNQTTAQPKVIGLNKKWYAIAATLVLFMGGYFFTQKSTPTYDDYNEFENASFTSRGNNEENLKQAENLYNEKKYNEAILKFETIIQDNKNEEIALTYAVCLIETNNFSKAELFLRPISKSKSLFKNKAIWYLGLSNLKQKNYEKTLQILKTLPNDAEEYNKAKEIVQQLE
jgi:hypothetical protein